MKSEIFDNSYILDNFENFDCLVPIAKFACPVPVKKAVKPLNLSKKSEKLTEYPVTFISAPSGYGKTTFLSSVPLDKCYWYNVSQADIEPKRFLLNFLTFIKEYNEELAKRIVTQLRAIPEFNPDDLFSLFINNISADNKNIHIVFEDCHIIEDSSLIKNFLEFTLANLPSSLHIIITSRSKIELKGLWKARMKGQVLDIGAEDLAFDILDVWEFFREEFVISHEEVSFLHRTTEGWVMALELIKYNLKNGIEMSHLREGRTGKLEDIFRCFMDEMLEKMDMNEYEDMMFLSVADELNCEICSFILNKDNAFEDIKKLQARGFFIFQVDSDTYRFHQLFREILYARLNREPEKLKLIHQRAGTFYKTMGDYEKSINHFIQATDYMSASEMLVSNGDLFFRQGRWKVYEQWIELIPSEYFRLFPELLVYKADYLRLSGCFNESAGWYKQAISLSEHSGKPEIEAKAYRGIAMIYLDTVQPEVAKENLKKALLLTNQENTHQYTELLNLNMENSINIGDIELARKYRAELNSISACDEMMEARFLLRTGRLDEALEILKNKNVKIGFDRLNRAHREIEFLLTFIYVLRGEIKMARYHAAMSIRLSSKRGNNYSKALALMRLGHVHLLSGNSDPDSLSRAFRIYKISLGLIKNFDIPRIKVEPLIGLALYYLRKREYRDAVERVSEARDIIKKSGDLWIGGMVEITAGIAFYCSGKDDKALEAFSAASYIFDRCSDPFGAALSHFWMAVQNLKINKDAKSHIASFAEISKKNGYDFILTDPHLFGVWDEDERNRLMAYFIKPDAGGNKRADIVSKEKVFIYTLGRFALYNDDIGAGQKVWKRKKALQLFHLLLTFREKMQKREIIFDYLWPDSHPGPAYRDFRVALTIVYDAISPGRKKGEVPDCIKRDGDSLGFFPDGNVWIDFIQFEKHFQSGKENEQNDKMKALGFYNDALELYRGDYLPDLIYDDWTCQLRERLRAIYHETLEKTARLYISLDMMGNALISVKRLLENDRYSEDGYYLLIYLYYKTGKSSLALRTFQKFREMCLEEFIAEPGNKLMNLYECIKKGLPVDI